MAAGQPVKPLRIGIVDSGVDRAAQAAVAASRGFRLVGAPPGDVLAVESRGDRLGHGTAVAGVLRQWVPGVALLNAQVFEEQLTCNSRQVVAALDWLLAEDVRLINLSFGLLRDCPELAGACARALERGVVLVAASPARGAPVFPASYPGVIRATGDARCAPGELSHLDSAQADFGACVRVGSSGPAGASIGCAHVTAAVAKCLLEEPDASLEEIYSRLAASARFRGPERRR
jgi:subtilisin family serine protease